MCSPVAYDKSITRQKDGTFLLTIREDDKTMNIPFQTLEEAQGASDFLPPDYGDLGPARLEWEIYKVIRQYGMTEREVLDAVA